MCIPKQDRGVSSLHLRTIPNATQRIFVGLCLTSRFNRNKEHPSGDHAQSPDFACEFYGHCFHTGLHENAAPFDGNLCVVEFFKEKQNPNGRCGACDTGNNASWFFLGKKETTDGCHGVDDEPKSRIRVVVLNDRG